ncbi:MAG: tetratricopeptide repeat protein [Chitinophagaceae bacterium]|nr:MAG: tetratricopeptide repeat protein [Chitinophagaceae bacterium]
MDRIEKLKEYLVSKPGDAFLQHALALEYVKLGREEDARLLFTEILERDPSYTGSYYHLGKLLERTGETEQAIAWYEKGMKACQESGDRHAYGELRGAYEELTF